MSELFLQFTDKNGDEKEVSVEQEEFVIGRHSENDLTIVNSKLSRQHAKIQRFADVFIITDLESSNGTKINGEDLDEPIALKNGDVINLGGGLEIKVQSYNPDEDSQDDSAEDKNGNAKSDATNGNSDSGSSAANSSSSSSQKSSGSGIGKALILAPVLVLFLLVTVIGAVIVISGLPENEIAKNNDTNDNNDNEFITTSTPDDIDNEIVDDSPTPDIETTNTPETIPTNEQSSTPVSSTPTETDTPQNEDDTASETPPVKEDADEIGKIRGHSFRFMRKIARSNQKPVLLTNQLKTLESRIKQFKGSKSLARNIKNAQNNAAAIQELARSKNLKPQFLVTAALAKLGNSNGNVLAKAREMAEPLDNLNIQIGDEQADDNLIIIAAYNQGVAGQNLKMRNTLQRLAGRNPNRASEIRTIWFLKEKNEISDTQFNLALRFLAIGTITQNPSAYSVNAKALNL